MVPDSSYVCFNKNINLTTIYRDMETMELEPLTSDGRGNSTDEETPAVKRILK